jgi:diguanylate cyclase (GGDEF)-like protein
LDLDDFRAINESLGYEAGDSLLLAVAERLETTGAGRWTTAHFGGDQFAVLLEDVARSGEAVRVAERIEEDLRGPFDLLGLEWVVTASIGMGLSASYWEPPEAVLRRADAAMYRAKEAGKGRHWVSDPGANESASP